MSDFDKTMLAEVRAHLDLEKESRQAGEINVHVPLQIQRFSLVSQQPAGAFVGPTIVGNRLESSGNVIKPLTKTPIYAPPMMPKLSFFQDFYAYQLPDLTWRVIFEMPSSGGLYRVLQINAAGYLVFDFPRLHS